jgi:hypothetical protein
MVPPICQSQSENTVTFINGSHESDSLINEYYRIIDGLNLNYVNWYHSCFSSNTPYDSIKELDFIQDSITYWSCYNEFFNQDINIVYWLLTFYKDRIRRHHIKVDEIYKPLWRINPCPFDSYLSECNLFMDNSRPAIVLIENFFDGSGFTCYDCLASKKCERDKYKRIKKFIKRNNNESVEEMRTAWEKSNAR